MNEEKKNPSLSRNMNLGPLEQQPSVLTTALCHKFLLYQIFNNNMYTCAYSNRCRTQAERSNITIV